MKSRTRAEIGRSSRRKGHEFMVWVAKALHPTWAQAERREQYRGGVRGCDVEGTPLWIECKRIALQPSDKQIQNWLLQAVRERDSREPVGQRRPVMLIVRPDRMKVQIYHEPGTLGPNTIRAGLLIMDHEKKEKEKSK